MTGLLIAGAGVEPKAESGLRFAHPANIAGAGLDAQREAQRERPLFGGIAGAGLEPATPAL